MTRASAYQVQAAGQDAFRAVDYPEERICGRFQAQEREEGENEGSQPVFS